VKDTFRELFIGSPESSAASTPRIEVKKKKVKRRPSTAGVARRNPSRDNGILDLATLLAETTEVPSKMRPVSAPPGRGGAKKKDLAGDLAKEIETDTQRMVNEANDFVKLLGVQKRFTLQKYDRVLRRKCLRIMQTSPQNDSASQVPVSMSIQRFDKEYSKLKRLAMEHRKKNRKNSMSEARAEVKTMSTAAYAKNSHTLLDDMLQDTVALTKSLAEQMQVLQSKHADVPFQGFSCFQT